jgi:hypothetical protein
VKWALSADPIGETLGVPGWRTRVFISEGQPGWPELWVYVWPETPELIHLCDVTEPVAPL